MSPNFRKYVPLTFEAVTQVGGSGSSAEHEVSVNLRSRNCLFPKGWGRGGQETRDGSVTWAHRPVPGKKGRGRGRKRAGTCEVSCGAAGCNYRALGNRRHGPALLRHPLRGRRVSGHGRLALEFLNMKLFFDQHSGVQTTLRGSESSSSCSHPSLAFPFDPSRRAVFQFSMTNHQPTAGNGTDRPPS